MRLKEPMKIYRLPGREETMKALCEFAEVQMKEAKVRVMKLALFVVMQEC